MNSPVALSPFPAAGTILAARYELREEIGRGGYSVVYAAHDLDLETELAIKLLVPPPASAHVARERMRREVQAVRGLSHANVVALHDFCEDGPWSFIVMERIHGRNLGQQVAALGPMAIDDVIGLVTGVASALAAAHARGILHRDIKPQNILLQRDGTPRLVDFGSARLDGHTVTRTGGLVGTIQYTAPELLRGERADARADIYALGLTLYFALTATLPSGAGPHSAPSPNVEGHRPRRIRAEIPEWLDDIVARATTAAPEHRFPTAAALMSDLHHRDTPKSRSAPHAARVDRCLICQQPEPFGLSVCPRCSGAAHGQGDTLIFVKTANSRGNTAAVEEALIPLLQGRAHPSERDLVARGHRALIRVPNAVAPSVVETLALLGIPTRTTPLRRTWTSAPLPFYMLLTSMVVAGGAAGITAAPLLAWASPLVAILLLLAAQLRLQHPAIEPNRRRPVFQSEIENRITETFTELRQGPARDLLASLVCSAEPIYRAVRDARYPVIPTEQIDVLLLHACSAAIDLEEIDLSLRQLEEHVDEPGTVEAQWMDGMVRAEHLRDALVQRFLSALAVMHRIGADRIQADPAREALGNLVDAIDQSARAHALAMEEVESLLR